MMWIEAVLASMLLLMAMLLLNQSPPPPAVLLGQLATWQLEDRSALLAEFGSDAGPGGMPPAPAALSDGDLASLVFSQSEPFCYAWAWLNESNNFDAPQAYFSYSEDRCRADFSTPPAVIRSLRRGVWREGQLQFLYIEQAQPSS